MVEELEVECVHFGISKCDWKGQRQCLVRHLRDECKYGEVECDEDGCRVVVVRQDLERHQEEGHGATPLDPGEDTAGVEPPVSCLFLSLLSDLTILLLILASKHFTFNLGTPATEDNRTFDGTERTT